MAQRMQIANLFAVFSADTKPFDKDMKKSISSLRRQAEDLTQAGRIISASITLPLLAAGAASAKFAMDFETGMTKIITLVGMSRDTIEKWTPAVRRMAGEVGVTTTELGEALFYITSAGIRTTAALEVLESSAKAAAIGLGDTKSVAYAAVSAMNAYGQSNLTAKKAVSVLISTVREGNMEARSLPMAFGRVLPVASELGIAFDDVGASIAMMTRSGVTARLAAFALRSILMTMIRPTHESNVAIRELGMTWEQVRQIAAGTGPGQGLLSALQAIKKAAGGNAQAFARVIPNSRAFIGALQLVGDKAEYTRTVFDSLNSTTEDLVDKTFAEFSKTAKADLSKALAELSESAVIFGETLAPMAEVLKIAAQGVTALAEVFHKIPAPARLFIQMILGGTLAIGGSILAIGQFRRLQAALPGVLGATTVSLNTQNASVRSSARNFTVAHRASMALTSSLGKLSIALAAIPLAVGFAKWLDSIYDISGKAEEGIDNLKHSLGLFGRQMLRDSELFFETRRSLVAMAKAVGHSELVWLQHAKQTEENVIKMEELRIELSELNNARINELKNMKNLTAEQKHHLEYMSDEQALMRAKIKQMAAINKETREEYDLMTSTEVRDALDSLGEKYKNVISQGLPLPRVWKEMKGDIEDTLVRQNEYNEAAPQWVRDLAAELKRTGDAGLDSYIKKLDEKLPKSFNTTGGKIIRGMVTMGGEVIEIVAGGLTGGFQQGVNAIVGEEQQLREAVSAPLGLGFADGLTDAQEQYRKFADWLREQPLEVKIAINKESLIEALDDWEAGKYPDTGG